MTAPRLQGGRQSAAAKSATRDLFEDGARPPHAAPVAAAPRLRVPPAPAPAAAPAPQPEVRPRPRPLWHAVVVPELSAVPAAATAGGAAGLQRLCRYAQQFTSRVSVELPNALLLEIRGSVTLFGSLDALRAALDRAWSRCSPTAQTATAPTALAALWLARAGQALCVEDPALLAGALAGVPIACTAWDAERLDTLRALGITRLGELLRLPRSGLARRLGPGAVLDLDVALGRQAAPRPAFVPRQRFRARCDFETEVETVVYLQKALEPLLERCVRFLRERQAGVQALELELRHRALPVTRVSVGLAGITGERRRLRAVLDEKLQRLELPAPVRALQLSSGALLPLSADSLDAFAGLGGAGARAADTAPQLVERLRARLGDAAVYGVRPIAEHRPEAAWQRVRELSLGAAASRDPRAAALRDPRAAGGQAPDLPRPVWLLDVPLPLSADLQLDEGPERIESGWWDGKGVARDYYIARSRHGARWWVFQERHSRCWYLHGVFA